MKKHLTLDPAAVRFWWSSAWRGMVWAFAAAFVVIFALALVSSVLDVPEILEHPTFFGYTIGLLASLYATQASLRLHGLLKEPK